CCKTFNIKLEGKSKSCETGSFEPLHATCFPVLPIAYSPMPDSGDCKRPAGKDPSSWNVEEVVWFIKDADPQALGPHADAFRKHEIDGDALLLLKSEMMMKYLGLKLGPALKLCYHVDRLKQSRL
uniref:SAM domain-containing protein n=1 Tax=Cyclopterus lumpus TaxID=8103 RepID=A0A8C2ZUT6_CYCLU